MTVEILPSAWEGLARIKYRVQADFDEDMALNVADHILDSLERLGVTVLIHIIDDRPGIEDLRAAKPVAVAPLADLR